LISGKRELSPPIYPIRLFLSCAERKVLPPWIQELALTEELLLFEPSPREPASPFDPSFLQLASGCAATIQFPPGTSGETPAGGRFPVAPAGQKHIAVPTAPVIVGVIKRRKKFEVLFVPSHQPAPRVPAQAPSKLNGEIGQIIGIERHPHGP